MIDPTRIATAVRTLAEAAHLQRIVLFRSLERRDAREDSDLDLLVIEAGVANGAREPGCVLFRPSRQGPVVHGVGFRRPHQRVRELSAQTRA